MQDEVFSLKQQNHLLLETVNDQKLSIANLEAELEALQQYSRRENVCFSNLKIDDDHTCEAQVIDICNELGVEVSPDDLVATHPLPGKKGRGKPLRVIARFKSRSKAQQVFKNRKLTKNIDQNKKSSLFADPSKGVAVQPNITPKRAALLGQVKDAAEQFSLDSYWVDTKSCNIMLRLNSGSQPKPVLNTCDLKKLVPNYHPKEFILSVDPRFVKNTEMFFPSTSANA